MWLLQILNGLIMLVTIALPILAALVVIRAIRGSRRDRETFEVEAGKLLEEIREGQKETNRLLREHLGEKDSDSR